MPNVRIMSGLLVTPAVISDKHVNHFLNKGIFLVKVIVYSVEASQALDNIVQRSPFTVHYDMLHCDRAMYVLYYDFDNRNL